MKAKDVKIGQNVVPHFKSANGDNFSVKDWLASPSGMISESAKFLSDHGFLIVAKDWDDGDFTLNGHGYPHCGPVFSASDFEPCLIEVGDTVRAKAYDENGVVVGIKTGMCRFLVEFSPNSAHGIHNGTGFCIGARPHPTSAKCEWFADGMLDLVRKAKKPEPENPADTRYRPKNGERVRVLKTDHDNEPHVGLVGTVEDAGAGGRYVCGVRFDDGRYFAVRECEPAPATRRPTVGDWVEVVKRHKTRLPHEAVDIGHKFRIIKDDHDGRPYWEKEDDSTSCLVYWEDEVKLTTAPEQPKLEQREFKVGDRVRFVSADKHACHPEFYPVVGTVGVVMAVFGKYLDVQWPDGTTSDAGRWCCSFEHVEPASEPATLLRSEAEAAVKRAYIAGQSASAAKIVIDCNPSSDTLAAFWGDDK